MERESDSDTRDQNTRGKSTSYISFGQRPNKRCDVIAIAIAVGSAAESSSRWTKIAWAFFSPMDSINPTPCTIPTPDPDPAQLHNVVYAR